MNGWTNCSTWKAATELMNDEKSHSLLQNVAHDRNEFIKTALFLCSGNVDKENVNWVEILEAFQ